MQKNGARDQIRRDLTEVITITELFHRFITILMEITVHSYPQCLFLIYWVYVC